MPLEQQQKRTTIPCKYSSMPDTCVGQSAHTIPLQAQKVTHSKQAI